MNAQHQNVRALVAAMHADVPVTFAYTDQDGVQSIRRVNVWRIEKCLNGNVIVAGHDLDRDAVRKFRLTNIDQVTPGVRPGTIIVDTFAFLGSL